MRSVAYSAPLPAARHRCAGAFTMIEFVVLVCVIGVLMAVAADRLLALRADAESAAVRQVLGALRVGLSLQMLALVLEGRDAELPTLAAGNPMRYLGEPPVSYAGEREAPDPQSIEPGRWYFDRSRALLVYRVRYADEFASELPAPPRLRFRVRLAFLDRDGDGRFDPGLDGLGGVRVEPAEPFQWRGLKSQSF